MAATLLSYRLKSVIPCVVSVSQPGQPSAFPGRMGGVGGGNDALMSLTGPYG